MKPELLSDLRCPACGGELQLHPTAPSRALVEEGVLVSACGRRYPLIAGVPRLLPEDLWGSLERDHPGFFTRHVELRRGPTQSGRRPLSASTQQAFGDEWLRFPEIHAVHNKIFGWYFDGPQPLRWRGLRVLDAGCGMGRWLHFARAEGADVLAMDVSRAIDVVAAREDADCVQADLRQPPFAPASFDLVYSLGVLHHLEEPLVGLQALARLVKPGGELRIYVYRSLEDDPWPRRALLALVTQLRRLTVRLPFVLVHALSWLVAATATLVFITPRRLLRRFSVGDALTRSLPLAQYADVPFRMLVAEQFDRFVAPIEGRYRKGDIEGWFQAIGFELVWLAPGLGWRAIGRRPLTQR